MMIRPRMLAKLLLAVWLCTTVGATAPQQGLSAARDPEVEKLLAELGGDSWQARERAQQALSLRGPSISARLLEVLAETRDEEIRTRVQAVLRQIEEQRSTGPSPISLHLQGANPAQVFGEVGRQAYTELRPIPGDLWTSRPWEVVDVEFNRRPFWEVLRDLCGRWGVSLANGNGDGELGISRDYAGGVMGKAPVSISGPFMVVVGQIRTYRSVDLNQPRNVSRSTSLQLRVYVEPKVRVLQGASIATVLEAVDEKGNSLVVPGARNDGMHSSGTWLWHLHAPLMVQADSGRQLARLKGEARFVVQTHSQRAEIPDVLNARNVSRTAGGRSLAIKEIVQLNGMYIVYVNVQRESEGTLFYPMSSFRLVDAAGRALRMINQPVPSGGQIELRFQGSPSDGEVVGPPAKLIWEVPLESREVIVPFEFGNLPLP